jgi:S-DNA-T family DNA segregation ATPase FtsK/SpoIIIE
LPKNQAKKGRRDRPPGRSPRTSRSAGKRKPARSSGSINSLVSNLDPRNWHLSTDCKLDLTGILVLVLGAFTLLGLLSPRQGLVSSAWIGLLGRTFGWGMFVIPLALAAGGLWLLLGRGRRWLPPIEAVQVLGAALLYLAVLVLLHAILRPDGFAEGAALAQRGMGGGMAGAVLLALLVRALGGGGAAVVVLGWLLLAITLTTGISLPELFVLAGQWGTWMVGRLRPAAPKQPISPPAAKLAPALPAQAVAVAAASPLTAQAPPGAAVEVPAAEAVQEQIAWELPALEAILEKGAVAKADSEFDRQRARLIEETLLAFGAPAHVVEMNRGPTITQFGVEPDFIEGRGGRRTKVKVSKISSLADDLALALAAPSIRIEAPVPGKGYVGIEVPNPEIALVALRDVMESKPYTKIGSSLALGLGQDVSGHAIAADLGGMPHLLIAGTTGSGKSVCVNAIIASLLLRNTPAQLRFLMVDPKRVELTGYNGIPHLLGPVVVELDRVVGALQWVLREMDERYRAFAKEGVRNLDDYNQRMLQTRRAAKHYWVLVIDELADLMMLAPDETERVITRLAQLARATGIHLVIATQRPSVDVVTGLIKANFPARIAFAVASSVDSRVILDQPGAERLLGRGDMLFQAPDAASPVRMQGAFVSEGELARLIRYWKNAGLGGEATSATPTRAAASLPGGVPLKQAPLWEDLAEADENADDLFEEAVAIVRRRRRASISLLQRRLRIGYTRAARLIDQMEQQGIIGPAQSGSQPREVLDYGELTAHDA